MKRRITKLFSSPKKKKKTARGKVAPGPPLSVPASLPATAPKLKQRLKALQRKMDRWKEDGGHERFAALNREWHELVVEGSGNPYIVQFLPRLTVPIYRLLFASFYSDQRIDKANADHKKITAAIVAGRIDEAESAMRQHIAGGLAGVSEIEAQFID